MAVGAGVAGALVGAAVGGTAVGGTAVGGTAVGGTAVGCGTGVAVGAGWPQPTNMQSTTNRTTTLVKPFILSSSD
jgi:hypothetical protein